MAPITGVEETNRRLAAAAADEMLARDFYRGLLTQAQTDALMAHFSTVSVPRSGTSAQMASPEWMKWYAAEKALTIEAQRTEAARQAAAEEKRSSSLPSGGIQTAGDSGNSPAAAAGGGAINNPPAASQPSTRPSQNIVDIATMGRTPDEVAAIKEYVRRTNPWLAAQGGAVVQSTVGSLRTAADKAAADERVAAMKRGTPYGPFPAIKVGHVPDTALK